jgi:hypothetical protein
MSRSFAAASASCCASLPSNAFHGPISISVQVAINVSKSLIIVWTADSEARTHP